jgi:hypothetical protein
MLSEVLKDFLVPWLFHEECVRESGVLCGLGIFLASLNVAFFVILATRLTCKTNTKYGDILWK